MRSSADSHANAARATVQTRDAVLDDFNAIAAIYAFHVETGKASFEEVPPSIEEMRRRFADVRSRGLPWRVAVQDGAIAGYCYASPFMTRSAYRFTVEDSIYLDKQHQHKGIGARLLSEVIDTCTELGFRQMVAIVGDSANEGSLRLHKGLGFRTIGTILRVGFKFGGWVDTVYLQRALGDTSASAPGRDPRGYIGPGGGKGP